MKKNPAYIVLWFIFPIAIVLDTIYRCIVSIVRSIKDELGESFSMTKGWFTWWSKKGN